ncbi:MAG TPA: phosphatase PAP2 family protein [Actinomycetota bacterium]|nr:phosphatase PAP2 family protein [Actinomycetota bacterium]
MSTREDPRLLAHHRRALGFALLLLAACGASLFAVGKHAPELAPLTTVRFIGRFDATVDRAMDHIRVLPLTWLCKVLNVLGSGLVTIPVRIATVLYLAWRRHWARFLAFALTWATSEIVLQVLKASFHRGRPPNPLVITHDFSFPSGHAVATAATSVALVLALLPPGEHRRKWEWLAVGISFVMSFSRVYLAAHWFSDVVVGTMLGAGIAIFWAAFVTECRDLLDRARGGPGAGPDPVPEPVQEK